MLFDTSVSRSRRALLGAALGAAAATVAGAIGRPGPASANDPNDVVLGAENVATATTAIYNRLNGALVLLVQSDWGWGIRSQTVTGVALSGESSHGAGVSGSTGDSSFMPSGRDPIGVVGYGYGPVDTGVRAESPYGTALDVVGKAKFSRSGRAAIAAGRSYVDVTPADGLAGSPLIFATLQTYRSGVYVTAARKNYPSTGKFRIYLNKVVSRTTYVAWVVIA